MTEVLFSHMTEKPTVVALIDAAEAEFAIHGIEGSSLRAIMRAADTDTASIHYHFGNRERLARQVLDRILTPLNIRRVALLDNAVQETIGPIPLAAIIEALARPDIEASLALDERGEGRARPIGAIYVRPSNFVKSLVEERFRPVADKFMPHLILAVPDVPG
ncbi:MAG TPA: TetR/AcrR family transcriptional regulator, partial [Actinobacteria bacterium]|nr:TetR/AcrR family transcriptional regulator [Actinomycetota bacterium]